MKAYYPAIFEKEKGNYNVTFPDVPEAITCGSTLEQAIQMAKECLGLCLDVRKHDKEGLPKMSVPSTIRCLQGFLHGLQNWQKRKM